MRLKLDIPSNRSNNKIEFNNALFILGANGSGKTRLGAFIEKNKDRLILKDLEDREQCNLNPSDFIINRVTAQKVIQIPSSISVGNKSEKSLFNALINGSEYNDYQSYDLVYRYQILHNVGNDYEPEMKYSIGALNDYNLLLQYLFTKHTKTTDNDRQLKKISEEKIELEICYEIWEKIFNRRKIFKSGFELKAHFIESSVEYTASSLSDGERVAFYLIAKIIISPKNSIIIIDEPELHLNKAITHLLYNELMLYRNDCAFIFMTHDLGLASSFSHRKLWLKEYLGNDKWDYVLLSENQTELPEDLLFKVLGSRRNIIFVEGNEDSYDSRLYKILFPEALILPVGSCLNVITYVKSLNANVNLLNNIEVKGIIDRDRRDDSEIENLRTQNIKTIPYAEVENIFISEEIIKLIYNKYPNEDSDAVNKCIEHIKVLFKKQIDSQKKEFIRDRFKYRLNTLDVSDIDIDNLSNRFSNLYSETKSEIDNKFQDTEKLSYKEILKIFNKKSLIGEVSKILLSHKDSNKFCYTVLETLKKNPEEITNLLHSLELDDLI